MGCGASRSGAGDTDKAVKEDGSKAAKDPRKQSIFEKIPEIKVTSGDAVKLTAQLPRVIFIFGMVKILQKHFGFLPSTVVYVKFAMGLQTSCILCKLISHISIASCICTGGPGSGKGRMVTNLQSMFGMKLISTESIVLKHLPKKVQHVMSINSTNVRCNITIAIILVTKRFWHFTPTFSFRNYCRTGTCVLLLASIPNYVYCNGIIDYT